MILGSHLSIAGGLWKALERAAACDFDAVAIIVRNQRQWRTPPLTEETVRQFRRTRRRLRIGPVVGHGSYLINLAGRKDVRARSIRAMAEELDRCGRLGVEYYVLHPGSPLDDGRDVGVERISAALLKRFESLEAEDARLREPFLEAMGRIGAELFRPIIKREMDTGRAPGIYSVFP